MLAPKGRVERLQRRGLSRLCSPCSSPSRRLSEPPTSASSPFPYPYRVIGMVMIAFVGGGHVRQIWDGRHLDPPGGHLGKSPKRQLRNATLAPSCSYYASCAPARGAAVGALGSQT